MLRNHYSRTHSGGIQIDVHWHTAYERPEQKRMYQNNTCFVRDLNGNGNISPANSARNLLNIYFHYGARNSMPSSWLNNICGRRCNYDEECDVKSPSDQNRQQQRRFFPAPLRFGFSLISDKYLFGMYIMVLHCLRPFVLFRLCYCCWDARVPGLQQLCSWGSVRERKKLFPINWLMKRGWHIAVNILFCVLCLYVYGECMFACLNCCLQWANTRAPAHITLALE